MRFNTHYNLKDKHAFLSASQWHWINYDEEKLALRWETHEAAARGTRLHALAAELIELGVKLPKNKKTLNMYVNDGIGFKMSTEQILYYSDNCFGTADTISFRHDPKVNKYILRIHDLKTGTTPAHIEQLMIYAALFCLEYGHDPKDIYTVLRIYQNDDILQHEADPKDIGLIMNKIVKCDNQINIMKGESGE